MTIKDVPVDAVDEVVSSWHPKHGQDSPTWSSAAARSRHAGLRTYLWRLHLPGTILAIAIPVFSGPQSGGRQLVAIVAAYSVGLICIHFVKDFWSRDGALLILGMLDITAASLLAAAIPEAWYFLLAVQVTIVSLGWIESRQSTALLLGLATLFMGMVGALHGIDRWPAFLGSRTGWLN